MTDVILGLDTSNYKTSAAVFSPDTGEWQSVGRFLDVKLGSLGLRQSDALFMHTKALPKVISELDLRDKRIIGVAYSDRPRNVEGSYMPCFLAGEAVALSFGHLCGVPVSSFSHQEGHIASAAFSCGRTDLLEKSFLAWHLSGGTTELLEVTPFENTFKCDICGGTDDISAGQLIDRTGVLLGFPFPSGKYVEQAALKSDSKEYFKVKVKDGRFSLSGIENRTIEMKKAGRSAEDICAFVLNTVAYAVLAASVQKRNDKPLLVSGGVSVCSVVQNAFLKDRDVCFAQKGLGGDNALGAALLFARQRNCL